MKFNIQMAFMIMILISLSLPLIVGYILISYIKSLEDKKCSCSNDRRRKYIKYYGYFLIIFSILMAVLNFVFGLGYNNTIQSLLRIISFGINFLSAYLLYSYSNILEDATCKCSESWRRTFLKFYGYLLGGIFSFISFCIIATFIYHICQGDDIVIRRIRA
jgi:hypothetical protein